MKKCEIESEEILNKLKNPTLSSAELYNIFQEILCPEFQTRSGECTCDNDHKYIQRLALIAAHQNITKQIVKDLCWFALYHEHYPLISISLLNNPNVPVVQYLLQAFRYSPLENFDDLLNNTSFSLFSLEDPDFLNPEKLCNGFTDDTLCGIERLARLCRDVSIQNILANYDFYHKYLLKNKNLHKNVYEKIEKSYTLEEIQFMMTKKVCGEKDG